MSRVKVLVSACLLGERVRYDGARFPNPNPILRQWVEQGLAVSICPEVAGGLPVPRPSAEIQGGDGSCVLAGTARLLNNEGADVTGAYLQGARKAFRLAEEYNIRCAILKARSPSCGNQKIYDGSFSGGLMSGQGVTAALLSSQGIRVFNEDEIDLAAEWMGGS